jgi:sigma-B regulation protein RsbU (phosphoserine phosphatase)
MNEKIKYRKFRIFTVALTTLLFGVLLVNFFLTIRTPFSGTTYLQLPSHFYITENISGKLIKQSSHEIIKSKENKEKVVQDKFTNFIPPGSFLLAVNNNFVDLKKYKDSTEALKYVIKLIHNSGNHLNISVFIPNTYPPIEEMSTPEYFRKYIRTYEVKTKDILAGISNAVEDRNSKENGITLDKITFLHNGIFLGYLAEGGATDRAGIKSGDILLSVDNVAWKVELNPSNNGYFLDYKSLYKLRTQPKGIPLNYLVLRENQLLDIPVTLATFGIPVKLLIYFAIGIIFILVGWIYAFNNPQYIGSRLTGLWLILMSFAFGTSMQIVPLEYKLYGTIFSFMKETVAFISLAVILHSFSYFPSENREITRRKWIHIAIYSVFIIQIILIYVGYFAKMQLFNDSVFILATFPTIIFYIVLRIIYRKSADKKYSRVGIYMIAMFTSVLLLGNLPGIIPMEGTVFPIILWYFGTVLTALIPIFYLLIAWKYRIFDISIKIRKNMQYNLLTVFWHFIMLAFAVYSIWLVSTLNLAFLNVSLSGSNLEFFSNKNGLESSVEFEKILFLMASAIILIIIYKFDRAVQKIIDEKFYRQKFDYKKSQNELVKLIQTNFTLRDLARIIVVKLSELVHLKRVGTVFYHQHNNAALQLKPQAIFCYDSKVGNDFCNILDPAYYDVFSQFDTIVSIERLPDWIRENLERNGIKYIIPVKSKKLLLGTIYLGEKLSETAMTTDDFDFINSITSHISVAIENAFLYEELAKQERIRHELEIARNIQLASLPQSLPHISGLDVSGVSIPAHEVGGDFYDFYNGNGNDLTVVVGDVSGKGTSAALYMSKVQGILRTLNEFDLNPKDLFIRTNRLLYKNIESNSFITAIGAHFNFDKREFLLSRAGHLPLIKYSGRTGKIEYLITSGIGLGLANEDVFYNSIEEIKYPFEKDDIFFFLSDGLPDARNTSMEEFGMDRLTDIIKNNSGNTSKFLCDEIIKEVREYAGETGQFDDITAVVVKVIK